MRFARSGTAERLVGSIRISEANSKREILCPYASPVSRGSSSSGARGKTSTTPWPGWGVSGGLSYTASRFLAPDPSFAVTRSDDTVGLDAGLSYRWSRQLTLRADFLHADNRSRLDAYKYGRDVLTLRMHYDMR